MLDPKIEEAINNQINAELYSSYLYFSMSAYFETKSLPGAAHWMRAQALEEMNHVQRFFAYINDRGGRVVLKTINAPQNRWDSVLEVFEDVYKHEVAVTGLINDLMDLSLKHSDHATVNFMQWFIAEQVEEEASADAVVNKLKLVNNTEGGLFLIDQELAKRQMVIPPELTGAAK